MAYHLAGPPGATPWLVLHGGPGSGGNPSLLQPFDLSRQRVVVPDQRGSGRSRPRGSTRANTLHHLVDDLEKLRLHLGMARWNVLGGSWGATLALCYAARHPQAVERLVLRGAFDAANPTVQRLFRRFGPVAPVPASQQGGRAVLHRLSQLLQSGAMAVTQQHPLAQWNRMELAAALHGVQRARRQRWNAAEQPGLQAHWRGLHRALRRALQAPTSARTRQAWQQKFRVQAHVLARGGGLRPGDWSAHLARIAQAGIPCDWIHGQFDAVCPPATSRAAHRHMNQIRPGVARLHPTHAGHLGTDPDNARALRHCVQATPPERP